MFVKINNQYFEQFREKWYYATMQIDDSQEKSLEKRKTLNTILDSDISERSSVM